MAAVPGGGFEARHETGAGAYAIHSSSGYSPALSAGDFRFVPGQTAEARDEHEPGLDPEARRGRGLWKGIPIKFETDFIIRRKTQPTLQAVGADLDTVVKAQIYLRDQADVPNFREVWAKHFPVEPATTIIATETPGFIMPKLRIEINVIALARDGKTKKDVVASDPAAVHGCNGRGARRRSAVHLRADGGAWRRAGAAGQGRSGAAVLRQRLRRRSCAKSSRRRRRSARRQARASTTRCAFSNSIRASTDLPATLDVWTEALERNGSAAVCHRSAVASGARCAFASRSVGVHSAMKPARNGPGLA